MDEELKLFREVNATQTDSRDQTQIDVLVIEQGDISLGLLAASVDSVVPWQAPAAIPRCPEDVLGVVQDRGRLVTVHRYQTMEEQPKRIVVCLTRLGLVGIAATATRHVGSVAVSGELKLGVPVQTSAGALTLIDPEEIARGMARQGSA